MWKYSKLHSTFRNVALLRKIAKAKGGQKILTRAASSRGGPGHGQRVIKADRELPKEFWWVRGSLCHHESVSTGLTATDRGVKNFKWRSHKSSCKVSKTSAVTWSSWPRSHHNFGLILDSFFSFKKFFAIAMRSHRNPLFWCAKEILPP